MAARPQLPSQIYQAPFLVAANLTLKAIAAASGDTASSVTSQTFAPNIPSGTLVWSDEFTNSTSANAQPNPLVWTYDAGNNGGWGNDELEDYCAWGSSASPCSTANPSAYVGTDGYLHIVAQQPSTGVYTSARLKTEGLFSFQYGRFEVRAQVPEEQGFWPAAWLMGNNISTLNCRPAVRWMCWSESTQPARRTGTRDRSTEPALPAATSELNTTFPTGRPRRGGTRTA